MSKSIDLNKKISNLVTEVKTEKLKKDKKPVRGKNGGVRPNSGRKPKVSTLVERGIKDLVDQHTNEETEVEIEMPNGEKVMVKKPRVVFVMEKLFSLGMKGSVDALKSWLDRGLGKPFQPIGGDADKPIKLLIDF